VAAHVAHGTEVIDHAVAGAGFAAPTSPGLFGGHPGAPNRLYQVLDSDIRAWFDRGEIPRDVSELDGTVRLPQPKDVGLRQGRDDVHEYRLSAGAGYGDPLLREPWRVGEDIELGYTSASTAERFYGVVIRGGTVYEDSTSIQRDRLRCARLLGEEPRAIEPQDGGVWVTECLVRDAIGAGRISCRYCGEDICEVSDSYKEHAIQRRSDLLGAVALMPDTATYVDAEFEFREFYCPGCATLIETEIALVGDSLLRDTELVK
jgi:N-methylhydantoinase B